MAHLALKLKEISMSNEMQWPLSKHQFKKGKDRTKGAKVFLRQQFGPKFGERNKRRKAGRSRAAEKKRSSNTQEKVGPRKVLRQLSKAMGPRQHAQDYG